MPVLTYIPWLHEVSKLQWKFETTTLKRSLDCVEIHSQTSLCKPDVQEEQTRPAVQTDRFHLRGNDGRTAPLRGQKASTAFRFL
jgi:hypothetical protein